MKLRQFGVSGNLHLRGSIRSHVLNTVTRSLPFVLLLTSCGGGGGGGSTPAPQTSLTPVTYTGTLNAATISTSNSRELVADVIGGSDVAMTFTTAAATEGRQSRPVTNTGRIFVLPALLAVNRLVLGVPTVPSGRTGQVAAAAAIEQSTSCDNNGGSIRQTGSIGADGTGNLTLDFEACDIDGDRFDGRMNITVTEFDSAYQLPLDLTTTIDRLTIQSGTDSLSLGGQIHSTINLNTRTEVMSANLVFVDNITQESAKLENLVVELVYNNIFNTSLSGYSMQMSGRLYQSTIGYVDISMDSPWSYDITIDNGGFPRNGGTLKIAGDNNHTITVTPNSFKSFDNVDIGLDTDSDGNLEYAMKMPWRTLDNPPPANDTLPTANAGDDFTVETPTIRLDASSSTDTDYELLAYSWTLTQAPAASQASLSSADTLTPSITLDVPGIYVLSLVVNDGRQDSVADTITVTADGRVVAPLFLPYEFFRVGSSVEATAISDVNGDSLNDVVLTTSYRFDAENDSRVFVLLQNSTGQLQPPIRYFALLAPTQYQIRSVSVADTDQDGRKDVVVSHDGAIGVMRQTTVGTLAPVELYAMGAQYISGPTLIGTADFNNDGKIDIAATGGGASPPTLGVFIGNSSNTFDAPVAYPLVNGAIDMVTGDLNSDGLTDIATLSPFSPGQVSILYQQLNGGFQVATVLDVTSEIGMSTNGFDVVDLNGDGLQDMAVAFGGNRPSSGIAVFYQDTAGNLSTPTILPSYDIPTAVAGGDINGDGRQDLVVSHKGWLRIGVYLQQADGTLAPEDLYPIVQGNRNTGSLSVGDINGDGRNDVVLADDDGLVVLYNRTP